jgi:hypothetical protein
MDALIINGLWKRVSKVVYALHVALPLSDPGGDATAVRLGIEPPTVYPAFCAVKVHGVVETVRIPSISDADA